MSDIRDLYKLVKTLEENAESSVESIQLHDSFDIELNESFVIETGVVGFTSDGIIVEADEQTLAFLEINDVLVESEELDDVFIAEGYEESDELDEIKHLGGLTEDGSSDAAYNAISRRIMMQHTDILSKFGPSAVMNAIEDVASDLHDLEEIGSSDVSGWVRQVVQNLEAGHYDHLKEESKPGLWANIHAKRERIKAGSGERMRKPGSKGAPSAQDFKDAAKEGIGDVAKKVGGALKQAGQKALDVIAPDDEELLRRLQRSAGVRGPNHGKPSMGHSEVEKRVDEEDMAEAEYQGRKVPLGKPMQGDVKKSKVYVRKPNGKVVKVNFGDKNMKIKKSNPDRRKSFRARHNCDNPGPRWKARYWSCRAW